MDAGAALASKELISYDKKEKGRGGTPLQNRIGYDFCPISHNKTQDMTIIIYINLIF